MILDRFFPQTLRRKRRRLIVPMSDLNGVLAVATAGFEYSKALAAGDHYLVAEKLRRLQQLLGDLRTPPPSNTPTNPDDQTIHLHIDSQFLLKSFRYCATSADNRRSRRGEEVFHWVCGVRTGPRDFVAVHLVPVEFERQTPTYLRVDPKSNLEAFAQLDRWGLPLVAHAHSHPGRGPGATHPSSIDLNFQRRLEAGGHICVGLIFSQDGALRVFASDDRRFLVHIHGNHAKETGPHVYQLSLEERALPISHTAPSDTDGGERRGSPGRD